MVPQKTSKKTKKGFENYIPPHARRGINVSHETLEANHEVTSSKIKSSKSSKKVKDSQNLNSGLDSEVDLFKSNEKCDLLDIKMCNSETHEQDTSGADSASELVDHSLDSLCVSFANNLDLNETDKALSKTDVNYNKCDENDRNELKTELVICNCGKQTVQFERVDLLPSQQEMYVQCTCGKNQVFKDVWQTLMCGCETFKSNSNADSRKSVNKVHSKIKQSGWLKEINESCIIEIYGFPVEFKTQDLLAIFSVYVHRGFQLRWVDDTHALGIFPSDIMAYEVLNTDLPSVFTRCLSKAIQLSKDKARKLLPPPPPPRPKTCSASARRMVSGALGIKAVFTQDEIDEERELLKVAREQRMSARQRNST